MSRLPLVIVNPASASGATSRSWSGIASDLRTHFGSFNCVFTEEQGAGCSIAAREAKAGRELIIACGGDGTISEVANGILESGQDVELGVLPSGTGGDFRRTLGISARTADAALTLRRGHTAHIDVGRVSYLDHNSRLATRYFLNIASFGISSQVIERIKGMPVVNDTRWLPVDRTRFLGGKLAYAAAALETIASMTKPLIRVQLDERTERCLTVANFCVANARYFGGGMKIAPEAKLNDGLLDIVAIGDISPLKICANAYRIYLGTHLGMQQVHSAQAKRITARPAADDTIVMIEVDGELVGRLPAKFEVLPDALRIRL